MDKVELEVLARCDMQDAVGILVRNLGKDVKLFGRKTAAGDLDALHPGGVPDRVGPLYAFDLFEFELAAFKAVVALAVVVALPVDAAAQTRFGKYLFVELPLTHQLHLALKDVDLVGPFEGHLFRQDLFPTDVGHGSLLALLLCCRKGGSVVVVGVPKRAIARPGELGS